MYCLYQTQVSMCLLYYRNVKNNLIDFYTPVCFPIFAFFLVLFVHVKILIKKLITPLILPPFTTTYNTTYKYTTDKCNIITFIKLY